MDRPRCPGQDMRYWKPGDIFTVRCPDCGAEIEFFKDEPARPCSACGREVRNPRIDLGCAKWCKFAEQCLGSLAGATASPLVDRLACAAEKAMHLGPAATERARQASAFAREVLTGEGSEGCDAVLVQAAVLFAEAARHSRTGLCQPGQPGDPCGTKVTLEQAGLETATVARVCQLLWALHTGLEDGSREFQIVCDAVELAERGGAAGGEDASALRTKTARAIARRLQGTK